MPHGFGIVGLPKRGVGPLVKPAPGAVIAHQHPLAQGLVLCVPLNEGRGLPRDYARGQRASVVNPIQWTATGALFPITGASRLVFTPDAGPKPTGVSPFTIACKIRLTSTGYWRHFFAYNDYDPGFALDSGTRLAVYASYSRYVTWAHSAGVDYSLAVQRRTNATNDSLFFANGSLINTWTFTYSLPTPTSYNVGCGYSGEDLEGHMEYLYYYSRTLNPSEIAKLHAEPYSMFWLPGARRIFIPLETGGQIISSRGVTSFNIGKNKKNKNFQKMAISW